MALCQLVIDGERKGLHWFVVPLRDRETGECLPGVTAGDLGPKAGRHGLDSGYIRFTHVRVPRRNMLMRWAKLDADGSFTPAPTQEIAYATLVGERVYLLYFLLSDAAAAITIATRFSAARLQGPERQSLLFYQSHQTQLMPIIAGLYATRSVAVAQEAQWISIQGGLSEGKEIEFLLSVQELHAMSAGLKAWCSWWCADAIEAARRAMGGHSFSQHSGIPTIQADFGVHTQGGGPGAVVAQQNARYVLAQFKKARNGHPTVSSCQYLTAKWQQAKELAQPWQLESTANLSDPRTLLTLMQWLAWRMAQRAADGIAASVAAGASQFDAWNNCMDMALDTSRAHTFLLIFSSFVGVLESELASNRHDPSVVPALQRLVTLNGLHTLQRELGFLLEFGLINAVQASAIRAGVVTFCKLVRADAVGYVRLLVLVLAPRCSSANSRDIGWLPQLYDRYYWYY